VRSAGSTRGDDEAPAALASSNSSPVDESAAEKAAGKRPVAPPYPALEDADSWTLEPPASDPGPSTSAAAAPPTARALFGNSGSGSGSGTGRLSRSRANSERNASYSRLPVVSE
jgi:hypothetical protein